MAALVLIIIVRAVSSILIIFRLLCHLLVRHGVEVPVLAGVVEGVPPDANRDASSPRDLAICSNCPTAYRASARQSSMAAAP